MCILVTVLDEDVHTCVGFGCRCASLCRFCMKMCILVSALHDYVDNCVEICMVGFPKLQHLVRSAGRWLNARCEKCGVVYIKK